MTNTTYPNDPAITPAAQQLDNAVSSRGSMLKKVALPLAVASAVALASAPVAAKKYRSYDNHAYDYAKVVNVSPVYETYEVNKPIQHCYDEQVRVRDDYHHRRYDSKTPEIVGGIIGGVVGNRIGKRGGGKARDVATVVGAVLGGSIARDVKLKNRHKRYHHGHDRYETVQRCETRDSYTTHEKLVGYDVTYKYRGNVFHSQFDQHPGDRIKVRVTVDPV